jgi:hypothetical protein
MERQPIYLNDWKDGGWLQMVADFEGIYISPSEYLATDPPYANVDYWRDRKAAMQSALADERWRGVNVLLASYGTEDYGGDAFVLFERDGKLYEVNGGHCSCYGLGEQNYSGDRESQWKPEETTVEALQHRMDRGDLGSDGYHGNKYANELRALLAALATSANLKEPQQ